MSLDDLLSDDKKNDEKRKKQLQANAIEINKKNEEFNQNARPCFDDVILPAVRAIIKTFNDHGHKAHLGQDIVKRTYPGAIANMSFSVQFKTCSMQLDINAIRATTTIDFDTTFTSQLVPVKAQKLKLEQVTAEKINSLIEENVQIMMKFC